MRISSEKVYQYRKGNPYVIGLVPKEAKYVLDIGCGAGDNGEILKDMGYTVDGITISEDERETAQRIMRNVYVYNVERGLPSEITGKYDVIILSHVLEHICYPQQLLKDIHRILNPGGFLIIALPNLMHFRSRWQLMKVLPSTIVPDAENQASIAGPAIWPLGALMFLIRLLRMIHPEPAST